MKRDTPSYVEMPPGGSSAPTPAAPASSQRRIVATPYRWTEPSAIAPRQWLYGRHLIRGYVSALIAKGGIGKSSLKIVQALAMASGKNLLGENPSGHRLRVWLWNLEDPREEIERRIQAAAKHYDLQAEDLEGYLFVDSGRDQSLVIAQTTPNGARIVRPVADGLIEELLARRIDVASVDPFVSCHEVSENDNQAIDMVVKEWGNVAGKAHCAVDLIHHSKKGELEVTTESSRGAKALTDGCRSVEVMNQMTETEAKQADVTNHRLFFRVFVDKGNMAPPASKSTWYRLENVDLENATAPWPSDQVGVVVPWQWPDAMEGMTAADLLRVQHEIHGKGYRQSVQATDWVGRAVAKTLGLDMAEPSAKARIGKMLKNWIASGALVVASSKDPKGKDRPIVEVGEWAT